LTDWIVDASDRSGSDARQITALANTLRETMGVLHKYRRHLIRAIEYRPLILNRGSAHRLGAFEVVSLGAHAGS
jgi:hypothetical protein